jgi:large subunit ribosomal protein L24
MKEFSTHWKSSKNPKKQRKYQAKAPMHIKIKFLSTNLSKELRTKHKRRNIILRKGDTVKVMKGKFKGKAGKISEVKVGLMKVYIEGIQKKKQDGSMVNIPFRAPNLQITELNTDDKKRFNKLRTETQKKDETKKENKGEDKKK